MPQSGRRLQQKLFAWFAHLGLRKLDDSDGCVYVYDDPAGKEILAIGLYVDNLTIVHSATLHSRTERPARARSALHGVAS